MPGDTATATAEDVTEMTWEDMVLDMSDAGPDEIVETSGGAGPGFTWSTSCA